MSWREILLLIMAVSCILPICVLVLGAVLIETGWLGVDQGDNDERRR